MAYWLVDENNPLTARVIANRYWETIFGRGIVPSSEEFGSQGDLPTHPELLDWLATELVRLQWDTKALVRLLVTSAAYRQTSRVTPELLDRDPESFYHSEELKRELQPLILNHAIETERDVREGAYHNGIGAVVQIIGTKPGS